MTESAEKVSLKSLLFSDLVDSTAMVESLGDARAADVFTSHDRVARDLMAQHGAVEIDKTDGFFLLFDDPASAVAYALAYHKALSNLTESLSVALSSRVGILVGQVWMQRNSEQDISRGAKPVDVTGPARSMAERLMSLAFGGQTLLNHAAVELVSHAPQALDPAPAFVSWDRYDIGGSSVPIWEVGAAGFTPREPDRGKEDEPAWRPAAGMEIPNRPHWVLDRPLPDPGSSSWLATHTKTGENRAFKFLPDGERRRALKREVTVFRLLKRELGDREDLTPILDWNLEHPPFFVEAAYSNAGNLEDWARTQGGLHEVPLDTRLEIVAATAQALSSAHSVAVLHKAITPYNILITQEPDQEPRVSLTNFGSGEITNPERLAEIGMTAIDASLLISMERPLSGTELGLYLAPELLEGKPATLQSDIYALGILLYQMVNGDLNRALGLGWEEDIDDNLIRELIAHAVDRVPRRLGYAGRLAEGLRSLKVRHAQLEEEERQERDKERSSKEHEAQLLQRCRKQQKIIIGLAGLVLVLVVLLIL